MNIDWMSGNGHSVVFLGWYVDSNGEKGVHYWSSQKGTNGLGDDYAPLSKIRDVLVVRLTHPERLSSFDPAKPVDPHVPYDPIDWK